MKRILKKAGILLLVFLLGTAGTALLLNSESTDNRSDFNDAVFPEVMVDMNDTLINRMYGYAQPMQADFTRDSVTPLDTSKKLTFKVNPYDSEVKSFSYEIRTSDGSKVLENKKIKNLVKEDQYLSVDVEIGSDLRMNQEYSMQIALELDEGTAYYYTRVVSRSQVHASDYVAFVKYFYEACLNKESADALGSYLEPQTTGAATNYSGININSSLSEISWGNLAPQLCQEGIPVIKEINETTASVVLEYQLTSQNDDEETELYDVKEFYRMKYQDTRIYLLDFQRSANQVFDGTLPVYEDDGIILGVRDKNVEYMMNDAATVIAFVQEGDLWSYSPGNEKVNQVFSFRKLKDGDFRDSRTQHDIKIVRVTDEGDIDFVLYGYMNRGSHEGYEGIAVYHYNRDKNVAEERAFIPVSESFEFLKKDLEKLSYVNEKNELFLILAKNLYRINIEENSSEILEKGIKNANFVSSDNNDHAAWLVSEGDEKGNIKEIDFDTCKTRLIAPQKGQRLRTVGFMNEDLIYGMLNKEDILTDEEEHKSVGIRILRIEDFEGNVKKEYRKDGLYITDISVGNTLIEFELSAKSGNAYTVQKKDNIMNNKKASGSQIDVALITTNRAGTLIRLTMTQKPETDSPLLVCSKIESTEDSSVTLDTTVPQGELYYVYAYGSLDRIYTDPAAAVKRADAQTGVVLNRAQQYVWERGNKKTKLQMNIEDVPESIRTANWKKKELQDSLGDMGTVIDLTGCTLDNVLYEVSAQRPVIAKTGENSSVVIVGYDEYNTYLYDPATGQISPYGMNDSTALFVSAGNVFLTYIENVIE